MSRSGYTEDFGYDEPGRCNLYRGSVARALRGKRGQAMLQELSEALDSMPKKRLADRSFQRSDGDVCTLGCLLRSRGVDTSELDAAVGHDEGDVSQEAAESLNIARCMAAEVMFENDDPFGYRVIEETPEERWIRMRAWVESQIQEGT